MPKSFIRGYLLTSMIVCSLQASSQRPTISFLHGISDEILSASFDTSTKTVFILDKAGFVTSWNANSMAPISRFFTVPTYSSRFHQPYTYVPRKIIVADSSRVWIHDASNSLTAEQTDAYDRKTGKYIQLSDAEVSNFVNNHIENNPRAPRLFQPAVPYKDRITTDSFHNLKISYSSLEISIRDRNDHELKKVDAMVELGAFSITRVFFLTEDILIICGSTLHDVTRSYELGNQMIRPLFMKYNWKTGVMSMDRSFDWKLDELAFGNLSVANDSTLFLYHQGNNWVYQLVPSNFTNNYYNTYSIPDSYTSGIVYQFTSGLTAAPSLIAIYPGARQPDTSTFKPLLGWKPVKIHSGSKTILWTREDTGHTILAVTDFKGKLADSSISFPRAYKNLLQFSPNGKWIALMHNAATILIKAVKNPTKTIAVKTGLGTKHFYPAQFYFSGNSMKITYQKFNPQRLDDFELASIDFFTGKEEQLLQLEVMPDTWAVDSAAQKIALYFPSNLTDASVYLNEQHLHRAIRAKFRNVFDPTILLFKKNNPVPVSVIKVANATPVHQMLFTANKIVTLQHDGLLRYYDISNSGNLIEHWLYTSRQALLATDCYYAEGGMFDKIILKYDEGDFAPVGMQDLFFNAPHKIAARLGADSASTALYRLIYEKRQKQFNLQPRNSIIVKPPVVTVPEQYFNDLSKKGKQYTIPVHFNANDSIQRLYVHVNGVSVFGRNGMKINSPGNIVQLNVPLQRGKNKILIQALDKNNNFSMPVEIDQVAAYPEPENQRKLWVLSVGISKYADTMANLSYAAKDANDFATLFAYSFFDTTEIVSLFNERATALNITSAIDKAQVDENDMVLIYLSGHGVLNKQADFYFATHDMNFRTPEEKGLSLDDLISDMEEMQPASKVLFIDACNSGLVDRSLMPLNNTELVITSPNVKGVGVSNVGITRPDSELFTTMQKMFFNFRYNNNVNILSATSGNNYAFESKKFKNGFFTYSIIRGLGLAMAAAYSSSREYGAESLVSLKDLAVFVEKEMKRLAGNKQVPHFVLSQNADRIQFGKPYVPMYFDKKHTRFLDQYK